MFLCCYTSPDVVKAWIAPARAEAKRCYEAALTRRPTLRGALAVRFDLGDEGTTTRACEVTSQDTVDDPELRRCVVEAFGAVVGPVESDCGVRTITYPMVFAPDG